MFSLGHPFSFYNRVVIIVLSKPNWGLSQVSEGPQTLGVIFWGLNHSLHKQRELLKPDIFHTKTKTKQKGQ